MSLLRRGNGRRPPTGCGLVPQDLAQHQAVLEGLNGARTGVPPGMPEGAMCVQRFDDSLNSAIHITYRISLRSSSMPEPRDPLLKVFRSFSRSRTERFNKQVLRVFRRVTPPKQKLKACEGRQRTGGAPIFQEATLSNDPSAGSPTETLLRLLLPLNDRV